MCRSVDLHRAVLEKNDGLAAALRAELAGRGVTAVNLLSSPGSGKTELLECVLRLAGARGENAAALTADLATENDARRLARSGAAVRQVLTAGLCHLEAEQVRAQLEGWLPDGTRLLFVENVGNLVCPASYDLGESLRVVLMSVTEGEDKPVKYPTAFGLAHAVVLTKTDLAEAAGFDEDAFLAHVERINPGVRVLRTSARTGRGVTALLDLALAVAGGTEPHRPLLAGGSPPGHGGHDGHHDGHPHGGDTPGHTQAPAQETGTADGGGGGGHDGSAPPVPSAAPPAAAAAVPVRTGTAAEHAALAADGPAPPHAPPGEADRHRTAGAAPGGQTHAAGRS